LASMVVAKKIRDIENVESSQQLSSPVICVLYKAAINPPGRLDYKPCQLTTL
jgi:hypothetical protein